MAGGHAPADRAAAMRLLLGLSAPAPGAEELNAAERAEIVATFSRVESAITRAWRRRKADIRAAARSGQ